MRITDLLLIEHRLLRELMAAMNNWLLANTAPEALRERAAVLAVALDVHARREEEQLFAPLRARSEGARHLVEMMELVHDEARSLFEEIETEKDPKGKLWTILEMTEAHFMREEQEVFPLAESLLEPADLRAGLD
jgi:hemerythrin-like domain-containing protein